MADRFVLCEHEQGCLGIIDRHSIRAGVGMVNRFARCDNLIRLEHMAHLNSIPGVAVHWKVEDLEHWRFKMLVGDVEYEDFKIVAVGKFAVVLDA